MKGQTLCLNIVAMIPKENTTDTQEKDVEEKLESHSNDSDENTD